MKGFNFYCRLHLHNLMASYSEKFFFSKWNGDIVTDLYQRHQILLLSWSSLTLIFLGWFQGKSTCSGASESQSISRLLKWPQITQMEMVLLLDIALTVVSIHVNDCRPLRFGFLRLCEFSYAQWREIETFMAWFISSYWNSSGGLLKYAFFCKKHLFSSRCLYCT